MSLSTRLAKLETTTTLLPCPACIERRRVFMLDGFEPVPSGIGHCAACGAEWAVKVVRLEGATEIPPVFSQLKPEAA